MSKTIAISEYNQNSMSWSVDDALRVAREDAAKDGKYNAVFVVALENQTGGYTTNFWNSGLSASEVIALLEVMKHQMLKLIYEETL